MDACSALETVTCDAVLATADADLLPALTEMVSSQMWWEQSSAVGFYSPESTAQLLSSLANAKERANKRSIASAAARSSKVAYTEAPTRSPYGGSDPATHELIDSLLAAQADLAARLRVIEGGVTLAS